MLGDGSGDVPCECDGVDLEVLGRYDSCEVIFTEGSRGHEPERSLGMRGQVPSWISLASGCSWARDECSFRCCHSDSMNSASWRTERRRLGMLRVDLRRWVRVL